MESTDNFLHIVKNYWLNVTRAIEGNNDCIARITKKKISYLKTQKHHSGYYYVLLKIDNKMVWYPIASVVGKMLVPNPNPNEFRELNHIDEDKSNNTPQNLEWCTHKHNCEHGTRNQRIGEAVKRAWAKRKATANS